MQSARHNCDVHADNSVQRHCPSLSNRATDTGPEGGWETLCEGSEVVDLQCCDIPFLTEDEDAARKDQGQ